jgi:hypothetical protein
MKIYMFKLFAFLLALLVFSGVGWGMTWLNNDPFDLWAMWRIFPFAYDLVKAHSDHLNLASGVFILVSVPAVFCIETGCIYSLLTNKP